MTMKIRFLRALGLGAAGLVVAPLPAFAHPGLGHVHGFAQGFAHPLGGLDHVLAMVAVGLLAAQLGGRALWLLPTTFVTVMALAGVAAVAGASLPFMEVGVALSVLVLGAAVASHVRIPTLAATWLVGSFAIFHGYAHGAEMPKSLSGLAYGIGFVSATAILHAIGVGSGVAILKAWKGSGQRLIRLSGVAITLAGAALLVTS